MKNRHLYPKDWDAISLQIKQLANWHCQECGKACRQKGEKLSDFISRTFDLRGESMLEAIAHPQRYTLTVAHLDHTPANCHYSNLRALCAPCHLRYDVNHHVKSRKVNKAKKLENNGQLRIIE